MFFYDVLVNFAPNIYSSSLAEATVKERFRAKGKIQWQALGAWGSSPGSVSGWVLTAQARGERAQPEGGLPEGNSLCQEKMLHWLKLSPGG